MPDKRDKRLFVAAIFKVCKLRETKGIQNKGNYAARTILEITFHGGSEKRTGQASDENLLFIGERARLPTQNPGGKCLCSESPHIMPYRDFHALVGYSQQDGYYL